MTYAFIVITESPPPMKDIQGIDRGRCNKCRDCAEYTTGDGRAVRCLCGHTPSDHETQSAASSITQQRPSSSAFPDRGFTSTERVAASYELCPFPGCNQPVEFDLNTGEQGDLCSVHMSLLARNEFPGIGM